MKLVITRGIPASGKSTWAKAWIAESPDTRLRVNRDDLRQMLFNKASGVDERFVTTIQDSSIRAGLRAGKDVVVDNTNMVSRHVRSLMSIAQSMGADIEFKDFLVSLDEALRRDRMRASSVGDAVVRNYYTRFTRNGQMPPIPENIDTPPLFAPYSPDLHLPRAMGFDLDGTLAHMTGRSPYDPTRYHEDVPDEVVRELAVLARASGHKIVVFSGRSEEYRSVCEAWLRRHSIPFDALIMRKAGDSRRDDIVKSELFDEFIAPNYNFIAHFDDRNRVVKALRAKGIKVLQVADGNF